MKRYRMTIRFIFKITLTGEFECSDNRLKFIKYVFDKIKCNTNEIVELNITEV